MGKRSHSAVNRDLYLQALTRVQSASFPLNLNQREELCADSTTVHYVTDVGVWEKVD